MNFRIISFCLLFSVTLYGQPKSDSVKYRHVFFHTTGMLKYNPRIKPVDVSHPELLYRLPALSHSISLIGYTTELYNGKYSIGMNFGLASSEFGSTKGLLIDGPLSGPSHYTMGYFIEHMYETFTTYLYYHVELDRRIQLNNSCDLVIGGFHGLGERYPGHYSSTAYPLRLEGNFTNASPWVYGCKLGLLKNNWEWSLKFEKFRIDGKYAFYSLDNTYPDLFDTYKQRQYYFAFQMRYYYGRKKHSYRYQ